MDVTTLSKIKSTYIDTYAASLRGPILTICCGRDIDVKRLQENHHDVMKFDINPHKNLDFITFAKENKSVFSGAICMNVLEFIQRKELENTLRAMTALSSAVLVGIANQPDIGDESQPLAIREDCQWWIEQLQTYYHQVCLLQEFAHGHFFILYCSNYPQEDPELYRPRVYELIGQLVNLAQIQKECRTNAEQQKLALERQFRELEQEHEILLNRYRHIEKFRKSRVGQLLRRARWAIISRKK